MKTRHFQATAVLNISLRVRKLSCLENNALHQEQDDQAIVLPKSINMSIVQFAKTLPKSSRNIWLRNIH